MNFLYDELERTGYYNVYKQRQAYTWARTYHNLVIDGVQKDARSLMYSPDGNITAELVLVSNFGCSASDYPPEVAGSIGLIKRGNCSFAEKAVLAASAHAAAAIVYNNVDGPVSGTLGSPATERGPYVPIVGISKADGAELASQIGKYRLTAQIYLSTQAENRSTYNVIAQTKQGDPNNVVAIGGHTDSTEDGPGINDNGSGTISNLVIAKALTHFQLTNTVRFLFWTAEEPGLLGSEYYISQLNVTELAKIRVYLNFDMIASPNYGFFILDGDGSSYDVAGPSGSAEIEQLFEDRFESLHLPYDSTPFDSRSDYAAFFKSGIPVGGLFTGAEKTKTNKDAELFGGRAGFPYDPNYHSTNDNTTNLSPYAFLTCSKAAAFAVGTYAKSLDSIPPRNHTVFKMPLATNRYGHLSME